MQYDVVIVGAGIVGLVLANALENSDLKIAIIDRNFLPIKNTRVSALTLGSQKILENLNIWSNIPTDKLSPLYKMHVWDALGNSQIDFDCESIHEAVLGYIIENTDVQTALYQNLVNKPNLSFIPAELLEILHQANHISIKLSDQQILDTKLLIGADGMNSKVRELADIKLKTWDYGHTAIICNVKTSESHQQTAWQCFLEKGPLAFLPLKDSHWSSIVWSTSPEEAQHLKQLSDTDFCHKLSQAINYKLGKVEETTDKLSFPLEMRHAQNYIKPNIAILGDAAHTLHPLAGQGLNLGIQDAKNLAKAILTAHANNREIGALVNLRAYERARKSENTIMLSFVEFIKQAFQKQSGLRNIVNVGINITDKFVPLKNFFIRRAMGLTES